MNQQELIKVYKQLDTLEQSKDVLNLKAQIRETLYQCMRTSFINLICISRVIGYDELIEEFKNGIEFIETMRKNNYGI